MMKNIVITLVFVFVAFSVSAQKSGYKGKFIIKPLVLEQRGDSLYISILYDINEIYVKSRRSITVTPSIVTPSKNVKLDEIVVKGRYNYNVYEREIGLMGKREKMRYEATAPYAVVRGFKKSGEVKEIRYDKVIPYESWMADAQLNMSQDLCGCGAVPRPIAMSQLLAKVQTERVILPYEVIPHVAYLQPEEEAIKRREVKSEAFLDFVVNRWDIRPDYMSNPRELRKITDMIKDINSDKDATVRSITVIGYASPEGTLAVNQKLSENRANALVNYLLPMFQFPKSMYKVVYGGENWIGLEEKVRESDMNYRSEVLHILTTVPAEIDVKNKTSRKKSIMDLAGGVPYRYMLKEFFPSLRKAVCKIDYDVPKFTVEDAKKLIVTRPQNLSLSEMYLVANTYELGSDEFVNVFDVAVRMFPDDATANLNAAVAALSKKDIVAAEKYLDKVKVRRRIPEYDNAMGLLNMLKGDYVKAESYLKSAAEAGLKQANNNLEELNKKLINIEEVKKQKK